MKSSRHSLGGAERRVTTRRTGSSPVASTTITQQSLKQQHLRDKLRKLDKAITATRQEQDGYTYGGLVPQYAKKSIEGAV